MALLINSKKSKFFRWHDSGDVQDEAHLMKIFEVCELTPRHQTLVTNAGSVDAKVPGPGTKQLNSKIFYADG
jgi:hypothetical protein